MSQQIRILLTSCGGLVIPGMIKSLREENEFSFYIVGVDNDRTAIGAYFVDKFYIVPLGNEPLYAEIMLNIAIKENIDVIVPLSDEEVISLSKNKESFVKQGINILCSKQEAVEIATNKGKMLTYLKDKNIQVPEFYLPTNFEEFEAAVYKLGYPERDVVLKPTMGRGARGFWIISEKKNSQDLLLKQRYLQILPFKIIKELLQGRNNLPSIVVMEYLGGDDFNVDILASSGETIYCLPIKRIVPKAGPVQVGQHVHDPLIDHMISQIVSAFRFDFNINIEVAYRKPKVENDLPLVYEINPRVSAPIVAHKYAGINLLLFGILLCLGYSFPKNLRFSELKMYRYWQEIFL